LKVEGSDTNAARVADASRRGDAPTQLAVDGLLLLQSFLDRARSFDAAGGSNGLSLSDGFNLFYGLSLFDGLGLLNLARDSFLLLNVGPFAKPSLHILDRLSEPLHRR
jgi:hypothetical protein